MELTGFEEIVSGTPIVTWNVFGHRNKASVDLALKRTLRSPENKPNMANKANIAHAARGAAHSVARSAWPEVCILYACAASLRRCQRLPGLQCPPRSLEAEGGRLVDALQALRTGPPPFSEHKLTDTLEWITTENAVGIVWGSAILHRKLWSCCLL